MPNRESGHRAKFGINEHVFCMYVPRPVRTILFAILHSKLCWLHLPKLKSNLPRGTVQIERMCSYVPFWSEYGPIFGAYYGKKGSCKMINATDRSRPFHKKQTPDKRLICQQQLDKEPISQISYLFQWKIEKCKGKKGRERARKNVSIFGGRYGEGPYLKPKGIPARTKVQFGSTFFRCIFVSSGVSVPVPFRGRYCQKNRPDSEPPR